MKELLNEVDIWILAQEMVRRLHFEHQRINVLAIAQEGVGRIHQFGSELEVLQLSQLQSVEGLVDFDLDTCAAVILVKDGLQI